MAPFVLTLFTDDPVLATAADHAGIDRIGVDLEYIGKAARQLGTQSRLSDHRAEALAPIAAGLTRADLFARVNPLHEGSEAELEAVLAQGVKVVMLPYFKAIAPVMEFCALLRRRARLVALVETVESLDLITELLALPDIDELHFGLNDLRIQMGFANHFDVLDTVVFRRALDCVRDAGKPFGIAAVAQPGDKSLPVDPLATCRKIVHLGATRALVARSFFGAGYELAALDRDVAALRHVLATAAADAPDANADRRISGSLAKPADAEPNP